MLLSTFFTTVVFLSILLFVITDTFEHGAASQLDMDLLPLLSWCPSMYDHLRLNKQKN